MGACAVLGMTSQDAPSEDLESDLFLNSALQRFTCELYYRFASFLAPLSIGLITSRQYLSEQGIKNGDDRSDEQVTVFWFGIGVILALKMVYGLDYCIEELISRK